MNNNPRSAMANSARRSVVAHSRPSVRATASTVALAALLAPSTARAASATWNNSAGTAWLTAASWNPAAAYPGVAGTGANSDVATFSAVAISGNALGINMSGLTGNTLSLGAIFWNMTAGAAATIGNSSTTANGILQLNGASVNVGATGGTISNLLIGIGDSATQNLTIQNANNSGNKTMGVALNTANGTIYVTSGRTLTISSIISGSNGFTKAGAGTLALSGANTFTGAVTLNAGTLAANGNAAALGAGAATLTLAGGTLNFNHSAALSFGRNTTISGNTTIIAQKNAAGAGVTYTLGTLAIGGQTVNIQGGNVNSGTTGVTFGATTLSGAPTFNITNPSGGGTTLLTLGAITNGAHTVTVTGNGSFAQGGVWGNGAGGLTLGGTFTGTATLSQANTFTGGVSIAAGNLQLSSSSAAAGTGTILLGDTAGTANATLTGVASGTQALNFANPITVRSGSSGVKTLRLSSTSSSNTTFSGAVTLNSGLTISATGTGALVMGAGGINLNANSLTINNTSTGRVFTDGVISGAGSVTINSTSTGDYVPRGDHTYSGGTTLTAGYVAVDRDSIGTPGSPTSSAFGTGTLTIAGGQMRSGTGSNRTVGNAVVISGDPTFYTTTGEKSLTFSGPVTLSGGTRTLTANVGTTVAGTSTIFNGAIGDGGNNLGLTKAGTGNLTLGGVNTYTGTTTVSTGSLNLTGSLAAASSLTVNRGATFTLASGAVNPVTVAALTLGGGASGATNLGFDIGTTADSITSTSAAVTANPVLLNLSPIGVFGAGPHTLLSAPGGLTSGGASYALGLYPTGYGYALTTSDTSVSLAIATADPTMYWTGGTDTKWNAVNGSYQGVNWSSDAAGTTMANATPGAGTTVIFNSAAGSVANPTATTLEAAFSINDLKFNGTSGSVSAVTIGTGAAGSLTIAPASSADGINVQTGAAANVTVSAPVVLGAAQTWTVADAGSTLNVSGAVSGSGPLTAAAGAGGLVLSGNNTFSGGLTLNPGALVAANGNAAALGAGTLTLAGGTLDLNHSAALAFNRNTTVSADATIVSEKDIAGAGVNYTLGTLGIGAQTLTVQGGNVTSGTAGVIFGATTLSGAPTFNITDPTGGGTTQLTLGALGMGANAVTKSGTGTLLANGVISGSMAAGATAVTVSGGTLTMGVNNNTFTGDIVVDGATSILSIAGNTYTTTNPLGTATGANYKTVTLQNGGIFRVASGTYNVNTPSTTNIGAGQVFIIGAGGGTFDVASGATFTVDDGTGTGTASTASQIQGAGNLTKTGLGIFQQDDSTGYAGTITVKEGTLQPASANAFGSNSAGTTIESGAQLNVNGVTMTNAEPLTIYGAGLASNPQGALTNTSGTAATWVGPVTLGGNATIGMSAAGSLTINTTINLGASTLTFANNGTNNLLPTGVISGTGAVAVTGAGQYVPSGQSTYSGGTNFNAGTSTIPQANSTGSPGAVTSGPFGTGAMSFGPTAKIRSQFAADTIINNDVMLNGGITFATAASEKNFTFGGPVTLAGGNAVITSDVGTTVAGKSAFINGAIGDGGNAYSLTKAGTGNLTLGGANTYTGGTTVSAGVLNLTGSLAANTPLTVAAGAGFSMGSGAANPVTSVSALNLGAGTGTTSLYFDLGADTAGSDRLVTSAAATTANSVGINLIPITTVGGATTYDLISAPSGLSGATYALNNGAGGYAYSLNAPTDSLVQVTVTPAAGTGNLYWRGGVNTSWSGLSSTGAITNWTTDVDGTTNAGYNPAAGNTVVFSAANATGPTLSTTLDNNYTISNLQFAANPAGVTAVTIGAGGAFPGGVLTLATASATDGISVAANAGNATISAPVVLGTAQTWDVDGTGANGSALTISGPVTGAVGSTLAINGGGTGVVTLSAAAGLNTYSGPTTVENGGILQSGAANSFSANSPVTVSGTGILRLNGISNTVPSLVGDGTIQNNHASTTATLTVGDASDMTFSGVVQNGGVGTLGLAKAGVGSLTLTAPSTHTGNTTVTNGTLNISGTGSITGNTTTTKLALQPTVGGNSAVVNYSSSATSTFFGVNGANVAGTASVLNQSAGFIQVSPNNATNTQSVVTATGAYGAYNISGGTFRVSTGAGGRFTVSDAGTASATNGTSTGVRVGIVNVSGTGFIDHTNAEWWLNYSLGQINVTDSGKIDHTGSTSPFGLVMNTTVVGGGYGVLNLAGTGSQVITGNQPLRYGNATGAGQGDGLSAFVNLAAGTLSTGTIGTTSLPAAPTATNYIYYNYAGGTLKATAALSSGWTPASGASATVINTIYGAVDNSAVAGAPSFAGGLTVDTNGYAVTIPSTQPLLGATGVGVTQANLAVSGGSGYLGAPSVTFSKPADPNGVAASGYALMSGGSVAGIVITDPGVYAAGETPTITLLGGFASGAGTAATVTSSPLTTNNTSGGLTKVGAGTLTLSGAGNTYSAGTTVSDGTLALGISDALPATGSITVNGGTFDMATFNNSAATVSLQSGSITGSTGVLTAASDFDLRSGTVNFTDALGGLAGAGSVVKTTAGTVTLANKGLGAFANAVNINGGTLAFSAGDQLGNASATNTLGINGGTLSYTGNGTTSLAANQVLTLGGSGGTLHAGDASGVLNLVGGVTTASAANLTKTGLGTIAITGSTNLNGGNVTVSAGVLNAGFTATGLGGINVATGATLNFYDGTATTMAINSLILGAGSSLGFDLNAPGANDILNLTGAAGVSPSVSLNFNNLGGLATGTYDLLNVTAGSLTAADFALGSAPSGFNYVFTTANANQTLRLTTTPLNLVYWQGDVDGSWSTLNAGPDTNWSNVANGATDLGALPAATDTLVFSADNAAGPAITTTLDGSFTVDSLRFAASPAGVTSVNINQGSGGTLTIAPVGSNNGISIASNAGAVSIAAPVTAGAAQTWEVVGGGTNGSSLGMGGSVTYSSPVTKTGSGVLTLSGSNTGAGGLTLAGGTLNFASGSALGTGTFTIGAGTTIDASAAPIVNTANNGQSWNGSFTFTGTNNLDLGTGAVTLGNSLAVTTAGGTLTVGGAIGDGGSARSLTKTGAGTLTLSGVNTYTGGTIVTAGTLNLTGNNTFGAGGVTVNGGAATISGVNTYTGDTTVNAGTLNLGNAAAIGSGTLVLAGGTLDNSSGGALTLSTNNPQTWSGNFSFTGTNSLNLGTGAVALSGTPTVTVSADTLTVAGNVSGGVAGLTKAGDGTLVLTGSNSYTGVTTVSGGTLRAAGPAGPTAFAVTAGTLQLGSATALDNANNITLSGTGTLDLFGNDQTIGTFSSANTNLVTNTGAGTGTNTLTVNPPAPAAVTIAALVTDGPTAKTALRVANNNSSTQITTNSANTFSGGLTLAHPTSGAGTRLQVGTISGTPWGSGSIILGEAATDKAGIYFNTANQNLPNPIVFNTALGTDRYGIRSDVAGSTLSGQITANSDAVFSSNGTGGALILTNKITGAGGLAMDLSQTSTNNTVLNVTLNNPANSNDYQGDTIVGRTNATPAQNYTATLTLGASNQIPNGAGKGNVILNNHTTSRTGNLNLAGFSDTINGLSGNGTVDGTSGAPVLSLGDNNATATFSGILKNTAGALAVTKIGSGTQILSGINTHTGATTVSDGILTLSGNRTAPATGGFNVGNVTGGTGTLNVTNGTFTVGTTGSNFLVGGAAGGIGILNQSGGSLTTAGNQLLIGNGGATGTYNLSAGTLTTIIGTLGVTVGVNTGSTATFNLSDSGTLTMPATSTLQITRSDNSAASGVTGTFNQTGGTATVGILQMGGSATTPANNANANATLNLTGGTFAATTFNVLSGADNSTSTIHIGGTAQVTLPAFPANAKGTGATATITFDSTTGFLSPAAASATYMPAGTFTNAYLTANGAKFNVGTGNDITIGQLLEDAVSPAAAGTLTKSGGGTLTLSGANTYTGKTIVSAGGLTFNTIGNVGAGASALGAPTTVADGTIDLNGILTYIGTGDSTDRVINLTNPAAGSTINNSGTGPLTLNGSITGNATNILFRGAGNITMNGLIPATHAGTVTHTDAGTLTLTNPNNAWAGALIVSKGVVSADTIANKNLPSAIGAGTSITLGQSGFNNTGTLQFTGAGGGSTDRDIDIQSNGTSGNGGIIENTVAGQLLTLSGNITVGGTGTLPSLGLAGAGNGLLSSNIPGGAPTLAVTKSGTGTWTLSGTNAYTGNTIIDQGTLVFAADQNLAGGLVFGSSSAVTTAGTLDLSTVSATFAGALNVRTNSADANVINIGTGETLAVDGGMSVGVFPAATGNTTMLTATGGGALTVGGAASIVDIGMPNSDQNAAQNSTTVDFTGLASFSANVDNFRIGWDSRNAATLLGSNTANSITANFLRVGHSNGDNAGTPIRLTLGTGTNVINASTIQLGLSKATATIAFASQASGSPGTLTLRGTTGGTSTADMTIGSNNGTSTGVTATGTLDLRGHVVDVLAGTLIMGQTNIDGGSNNGSSSGTVSFDSGSFAVNTLDMAPKTGNRTGAANATLNIGGGSFTVNGGGSFTLGSQVTAGSSNATLNLTGGTFTSNVDIVAGTGTTNSAITLNGGILDLTGKNIGGATAVDNLNLQSGTLKDVGQINNGGAISKTTTGTLIIDGTNTWTGSTSVSEGTLVLASGSGAANSAFTIGGGAATATLDVAGNTTIGAVSTGALLFDNNSFTVAQLRSTIGNLGIDRITLNGNLGFNGTAQLTLTDIGANDPLPGGTKLALMNYTGFTWDGDAFANYPDNSIFTLGANQWAINYNDTTDGTTPGQYVTLTIATTYNMWAAAQVPALAANSQDLDADGDGKSNELEYGFGTDPHDPASGPDPIDYETTPGTITPGAIKIVKVGAYYKVVFGRRKVFGPGVVTYTVRFSSDLTNWDNSATAPVDVTVPATGNIDAVSVPFPNFINTPSGPRKPRFAQVEVVAP